MEFADDRGQLAFPNQHTEWTPAPAEWETIKQRSRGKTAKVTVLGFQHDAPTHILSRGQVCISTSEDEVGAPLFYRGVNLPFAEAVKDPLAHPVAFWRRFLDQPAASGAGAPASVWQLPFVFPGWQGAGHGCRLRQQQGVLRDYARGERDGALASSEIMTWDDYKREDGQQTLGLLSQIFPDGQLVGKHGKG